MSSIATFMAEWRGYMVTIDTVTLDAVTECIQPSPSSLFAYQEMPVMGVSSLNENPSSSEIHRLRGSLTAPAPTSKGIADKTVKTPDTENTTLPKRRSKSSVTVCVCANKLCRYFMQELQGREAAQWHFPIFLYTMFAYLMNECWYITKYTFTGYIYHKNNYNWICKITTPECAPSFWRLRYFRLNHPLPEQRGVQRVERPFPIPFREV